jgi:transketolase
VAADRSVLIPALHNIATQLRIGSVRSTSEAGSGHPSSCCSAADVVAALFFAEMRFDPKDPQRANNDRFVLSKGHAAPLLYAAWAEAGFFDRAKLLTLRQISSDLEGHPTPRLPFVDVATGSLGQGLGVGVGLALNARRIGSDYRTYVLMGDGESVEGSVWEAANVGSHYDLDHLCGITDVNGLGQSQPTQWRHDMDQYARRWRAFGWEPIVVDGHDLNALLDAFAKARATKGRPAMLLARTIKGKGISFVEGKDGWHGRPLKKGEELDRAIKELESQFVKLPQMVDPVSLIAKPAPLPPAPKPASLPQIGEPSYAPGEAVATREAYGTALVKLGQADQRIVVLDADVGNSTYSEKFFKAFPDRFYEIFIAEQAMLGVAMGLASRGAIAFPSTFACFLTRACDFIRMACISNLNVKLCGSHAGISIGEDGPSQMGLEDLAMMRAEPNMTVVYPCDGVSTERLVAAIASHRGPAYIRTSRPKTPVIYPATEQFEIGGSKVLRQSSQDLVTVVAAGITVYETLKAYDALKADGAALRVIDAYSVQPIDARTLREAARATGGRVVTVEDHYLNGGLGDAVAEALAEDGWVVRRLAVREIPQSGKPEELLDRFGISAKHIVAAVRTMVAGAKP